MNSIECPSCGFKQDVVLGDYSVYRGGDGVEIYETGIHGAVKLAEGDTLPEALREAATAVED